MNNILERKTHVSMMKEYVQKFKAKVIFHTFLSSLYDYINYREIDYRDTTMRLTSQVAVKQFLKDNESFSEKGKIGRSQG